MIGFYLGLSLFAANAPWLSDKFLFIFAIDQKKHWHRLLEWCVLCFVFILLGFGLERKENGLNHSQEWEFYAIAILLFMVFAIPGFIFRYDYLKPKKPK